MKVRPFSYNPTLDPINGVKLINNVAIGYDPLDYSKDPGGIRWWNGPDEDLGYVIGTSVPTQDHKTPHGNIGNVRFWRSKSLTEDSFIYLTNWVFHQNFSTGRECQVYLNNNGYWTTYVGGSIKFNGTTTSYLTIPNNIDFRFRTGDFTIEWMQYQTDSNTFPRPWTLGSWPNSNIGVSIESNIFGYADLLFWYDGSTGSNIYYNFGNMGPYKNQWIHLAIARSGTTINAFKNGIKLDGSFTSSYDFNDTGSTFAIGGEPNHTYTTAVFGGYITNFNWIKGTCLYNSAFTPPSYPLNSHANSKLLMLATKESDAYSDNSGSGKVITSSNTTWDVKNPFTP